MATVQIERVDSLPLILDWLDRMHIAALIDRFWHPHGNWSGVSYGQLAVLFLAFVLYTRTHRLSYAETWQHAHQHTLERCTGWQLLPHELSDDRLGHLLGVLGADPDQSAAYQEAQSQHVVRAYALPTNVVRYDTSTFNVEHAPEHQPRAGLLRFGHSKDHRPDLLQFKAGVGTLDPAGLPLWSDTLPGNAADDPLYVPAWHRAVRTLGHTEFLWVTDCKGAALETRATIAAAQGAYLVPLPLTGATPALLAAWVAQPPAPLEDLYLAGPDSARLGVGFAVERPCTGVTESGAPHTWTERCLVVRSDRLAARQRHTLDRQLTRLESQVARLRARADETAADFLARAQALVAAAHLLDVLLVTVTTTNTTETHYARRGRPGPDTPGTTVTHTHLQLTVTRDAPAYAQRQQLCGWRIYVTNLPVAQLSLAQATAYYRDQWLNERSYHRFKHGSLPILPLFLQLETRIRGLVLLLTVALQAVTLLEYSAQQHLAQTDTALAGLVPGNPKMATARPSAERLFAAFNEIHLVITWGAEQPQYHLAAPLTALQQTVLQCLHLPLDVYAFPHRASPVAADLNTFNVH